MLPKTRGLAKVLKQSTGGRLCGQVACILEVQKLSGLYRPPASFRPNENAWERPRRPFCHFACRSETPVLVRAPAKLGTAGTDGTGVPKAGLHAWHTVMQEGQSAFANTTSNASNSKALRS